MKILDTFAGSGLITPIHVQYHINISNAITQATPKALHIEELAAAYATAVNNELLSTTRVAVLSETIDVAGIDWQRDKAFTALRGIIRNYGYLADGPLLGAARRLAPIMSQYKSSRKYELNRETAEIDTMLIFLKREENVAALQTLGLVPLVEEIRNCNNAVQVAIDEYRPTLEKRASIKYLHIKPTRKVVNALYFQLAERVNNFAITHPSRAMDDFIDKANAIALDYRYIVSKQGERRKKLLTVPFDNQDYVIE